MTDTMTKLVGVLLPQPVLSYLNLFLAVHETSKSDLIRGLIDRWVEEKKQRYSEQTLLANLLCRTRESWELAKMQKIEFNCFAAELEKKLHFKGLNAKQIETIIDTLKNDTKKS